MKAGGPLKRYSKLRAGAPLQRGKRLARVSKKQAAKLRIYSRNRDKALREAGGRCARCGRSGRLDVHHVVPRSRGGLLGALAALCRKCHDELHFGTPADRARWVRQDHPVHAGFFSTRAAAADAEL